MWIAIKPFNRIYSQTSSNALNIKAKGRSLIHAGIAAGAGCFKLKSVEREKVNMYERGGKSDKNKQEGASWETERDGGREAPPEKRPRKRLETKLSSFL